MIKTVPLKDWEKFLRDNRVDDERSVLFRPIEAGSGLDIVMIDGVTYVPEVGE